jgi:hypothetical protein
VNIKYNRNNDRAMPADPWTGWLERNSGENAQQTYGTHPIGSNGFGWDDNISFISFHVLRPTCP